MTIIKIIKIIKKLIKIIKKLIKIIKKLIKSHLLKQVKGHLKFKIKIIKMTTNNCIITNNYKIVQVDHKMRNKVIVLLMVQKMLIS